MMRKFSHLLIAMADRLMSLGAGLVTHGEALFRDLFFADEMTIFMFI